MVGGSSSASSGPSCKRCKAKVVNGIKCLDCENQYHISCAKILNGVKFVDDNTISCCISENNKEDDMTFFEAISEVAGPEKRIDIRIFNYIVKQKDAIIVELRDKVAMLNDQIDKQNKLILKQPFGRTRSHEGEPTADTCRANIEVKTNSVPNGKTDSAHNKNKLVKNINSSNPKNSIIENKTFATAVMEAETRVKCDEYINLGKQEPNKTSPREEWVQKVNKRQKRNIIVGKNTEASETSATLKGVQRKVALHVYRLAPSTTPENVKEFLKPHFPEVTCEAMNSRNPEEYSSFKVCIQEENLQRALDPTIWPTHACVNRFLYLRRRGEPMET